MHRIKQLSPHDHATTERSRSSSKEAQDDHSQAEGVERSYRDDAYHKDVRVDNSGFIVAQNSGNIAVHNNQSNTYHGSGPFRHMRLSELNSNLVEAIRNRNLRRAELLIEGGADVDHTGSRPLVTAITIGDLNCAQLLLDNGVDTSRVDDAGNTPLYAAILSRNLEMVRVLLATNVRIEQTPVLFNGVKHSIIAFTAALDLPETLQTLLDYGADPNFAFEGRTALMTAAAGLHYRCVEVLIRSPGVDVNAAMMDGSDALSSAVKGEHFYPMEAPAGVYIRQLLSVINVVQLLVDNGATRKHNRDTQDHTLLHRAVNANSPTLIDLLLRAGLDVDELCSDWGSPLHLAACSNDEDMIDHLVAAGANVETLDLRDETPFVVAAKSGSSRAMAALQKHGAKIARQIEADSVLGFAKFSGNVLHLAASHGDKEMVTMLLERGIDKESTFWHEGQSHDSHSTVFRSTALGMAAHASSYEVVMALLHVGASPRQPGVRYWSPLHHLCSRKRPTASRAAVLKIAQALLDAGADINETPKPRVEKGCPMCASGARPDGYMRSSALDIAVSWTGDVALTRLLLRAGSSRNCSVVERLKLEHYPRRMPEWVRVQMSHLLRANWGIAVCMYAFWRNPPDDEDADTHIERAFIEEFYRR